MKHDELLILLMIMFPKALLGSLLIPAGLETYPDTFSNSSKTLLSVLAEEQISLNLQKLLWQLDYNDPA